MMINKTHEGKWVRLKGISGHGKNRIREHGDIWLVELVSPSHAPGKVMLRSREKTLKVGVEKHFDGRWLDFHFEIVEVDV